MVRLSRLLFCVICVSWLTACSTMKSNSDADEKQKLKTAKINVQLGIAYLERNNVNRAKKKLLLALEEAPDIPETWYSMAYFLESTGNKEQAKKYYIKALSLSPNRGDVQNNYGTFLCRSGEYQASIQHFMQAVQDPDYLDTSDAYENAGLCALKIPNKQLAYRYFNTAITQNPSRPVSLLKLAQLDYEKEDYNDAKIKLDQYLAIAPATPQSTQLMAKINQELGEKPMATAAISANQEDNAEDAMTTDVEEHPVVKPKRHVTYRHYLHEPVPHAYIPDKAPDVRKPRKKIASNHNRLPTKRLHQAFNKHKHAQPLIEHPMASQQSRHTHSVNVWRV